MSRRIKFYPGPDRTTIWARTRKQALAKLRALPMEYEVYGMMTQGAVTGNFGVDAHRIVMLWWHPSHHPWKPDTFIRHRYSRKGHKTP